MLEGVDIELYLRERSTSVETVGDEQRFSHPTGCSSILIRRRDDHPFPDLPASSPLYWFYKRFSGASIGDSDLVFATPVAGGLEVSHGYTLPDFSKVRSVAAQYAIQSTDDECLFLVTYGWMFFYGYVGHQLRLHDRDLHKVRATTFQKVLDNWWRVATENPT